MANFAKNAFSEQELIEFCYEVAIFRKLIDEKDILFKGFSKDNFRLLTKIDADLSNTLSSLMRRDEYLQWVMYLETYSLYR